MIRKVSRTSTLTYLGMVVSASYLVGMLVMPLAQDGWAFAQQTWFHWQTLTTGFLALLSALIALQASRHAERKQQDREFRAARALLPASLDALCRYLDASAKEILQDLDAGREAEDAENDRTEGCQMHLPAVPEQALAYLTAAIRHASPEVGEFLAHILSKVQVTDSRLRGAQDRDTLGPIVEVNMADLVDIRALVDRAFPFVRGERTFDPSPISMEEYERGLSILFHRLGLHRDDEALLCVIRIKLQTKADELQKRCPWSN